MTTVLVVLLLVLVLALWAYADSTKRSNRLERAFAGRSPLTDEEFFENYFAAADVDREVPAKVRKILSEELDADLSRIAPDDDFTRNLQFLLAFDSLSDVAIVESLERVFSIKIADEEAAAMHTVNDIVLSVSSKLRAAQ